MIEIKHNNSVHFFSSNMSAIKLKQLLQDEEILGFIDTSGELYDLHALIQGPITLSVVTKEGCGAKFLLASLAFICGDSVENASNITLSVNENEFICKFKSNHFVSENDFPAIEKIMKSKIQANIPFERSCDETNCYVFNNSKISDNLQFLETAGQCNFPFKLTKIAEEIFRDEKIQKITGVAFFEQAAFDAYYKDLEIAMQNDHRVLGKAMDLFYFISDAPGAVFWLENGHTLIRCLEEFIRKHAYAEYKEVKTPCVFSSKFWDKSGHADAFKQNMMRVSMGTKEEEDNSFSIKPMNCPAHIEIFNKIPRSYRELPYRIAEFGYCHRYEPSGALSGLTRVRAFTMDDGHIFCTKEQIQSEIEKFMSQTMNIYSMMKFKSEDVNLILSTRPIGFLGDSANWDYAEKALENALKHTKMPYSIAEGEGAFYGPKIEMHIKDSMKRSWQLGTIQLDFVLPERFNLSYVDKNDTKKQICMLHRAILGSFERYIALLLEYNKGHLPMFLSPVQAMICTINSEVDSYAKKIHDTMKQMNIRVQIDLKPNTLSHKIRDHKLAKIPMLIIIGKEEMDNNFITVQYNNQKMQYALDDIAQIMEHITNE